MSFLRPLALIAGLSLLPALATPAAAAEPVATTADDALSETARELFTKGSKAWEQGKWQQCRAALLAAWSIKKHTQIAANFGACELKLGMHRDAAEHLAFFLHEAPADSPPERRAEVKAMLDEATGKLVTVTLKTDPPDAEVLLDGKSLGRGPFLLPMYFDPGTYVVDLRAEGRRPQQEVITGFAGMRQSASVSLPPVEPVAAVPPNVTPMASEDPHPRTPIVVVGLVAGGVALGAGIVLHVVSSGKAGEADDLLAELHETGVRCATPPQAGSCADLRSLREQEDTSANAGTAVLLGAGAVLAGTAAYMLWPRRTAKPAAALWTAPTLGPRGGGIQMGGTF